MLHYFNLKSILLLCALIVGVGDVWGTDVKYTISSRNTLTTTGIAPAGSSATLVESYSNSKQMTSGNYQKLTLKGYKGYRITKIVLSMHSNKSTGKGFLVYTIDGTDPSNDGVNGISIVGAKSGGIAFNDSRWNGAWTQSYTDITKNGLDIVCGSNDVIFYLRATTSSLYCQSYTITYEPLISNSSITITPAKYATHCDFYPLNFSGTGITAYKAKVENGTVKMTEVEDGIVPANTGVILYKDVTEETMVQVPVTATNVTIADNELVGTTEKTLVNAMTDTKHNYIMQKSGTNIVFKKAVDGA